MTVHKNSDIKIGCFYKTKRFGDEVLYMGVGHPDYLFIQKQLVIVLDDYCDLVGNIVIPDCILWDEGFIPQFVPIN